MKKSLLLIVIIFLFTTISCNKSGEITPNTKEEILKTAKGTLIGSPITQIIGNTGGKIAIPSAGATIIVPSGAMAAGASLTIQATSDMLDNEGQGIQISGEWQKPIWLEFTYPADETSPESNMIAYQTAKGDWITTKKVKVDKVRKTYAILLGQTSNGKAKLNGARPAAGSYSFAASHEFFMKPDKAVIDLGESVTFTAFARQGDTDGFWRKGKDGNYFYDDGELVPLSTPKTPILSNNNPEDDDYLVPLIPINKTVLPDDDDYLVPLTKVIKEAAFTNKKTGFTRSWILMEGPGNLAPAGNIGAKYTAPKDASAKGKTAKISFLSRNDKTKQDVEATATIRIKDGLTRYEGTISISIKKDNATGGKRQACGPAALIYDLEMSTKTILTNYTGDEYATLGIYGYSSIDGFLLSADKKKYNMTTTVTKENGIENDGFVYSRLVAQCSTTGEKAGDVRLFIDDSKKTFELDFTLATYKSCEVEGYNFCTLQWKKYEKDFKGTVNNGNGIVGKYTNINNIKGTNKYGDGEVTFDFKKID
jgi:hypothetical protein